MKLLILLSFMEKETYSILDILELKIQEKRIVISVSHT
jgi:hypothetical protein